MCNGRKVPGTPSVRWRRRPSLGPPSALLLLRSTQTARARRSGARRCLPPSSRCSASAARRRPAVGSTINSFLPTVTSGAALARCRSTRRRPSSRTAVGTRLIAASSLGRSAMSACGRTLVPLRLYATGAALTSVTSSMARSKRQRTNGTESTRSASSTLRRRYLMDWSRPSSQSTLRWQGAPPAAHSSKRAIQR